MRCEEELCENWSGDGSVCPCALFGIERPVPELEPVLLDGPAIAKALGIAPGTIRRWASHNLLTRRGMDHYGRTLYDLDEVQTLAAQRDTPGFKMT